MSKEQTPYQRALAKSEYAGRSAYSHQLHAQLSESHEADPDTTGPLELPPCPRDE
jgi:hypothetical protein